MKARFLVGFSFLSAIMPVTIWVAAEVQIVRLANPEAVVGAPSDSCRPALTGQGGPGRASRLAGIACAQQSSAR